MKKLFLRSEIRLAILFIIIYVVGNSLLDQVSASIGIEMIATVPFDLLLLGIIFRFARRNGLMEYYGLNRCKVPRSRVLFYVPLVIISTVNVWFGFCIRKNAPETLVYIAAMALAGCCEELIFRGLLYKAMCRKNVKAAVIVTSVLFGIGHIVNLFNGSGMELVANVCQLFYAVAIGFLFVSIAYTGQTLVPCMAAHAVFNALSVFANEAVFDKVQIPVCCALCLILGISAAWIFRNGKSHGETSSHLYHWFECLTP